MTHGIRGGETKSTAQSARKKVTSMELLVTRTSASVGEIQLRSLRWNRAGEKNILVYEVSKVVVEKVAGKLEKGAVEHERK
ncbi:hypothetical protein PIB30_037547 [Stylosanthes scabra]|uniref:Uncharacterized protein n=1 Tax=Stylosanthes scabra TaxID=79078 RepID=A0ABU6SDL7_9FABA|nr:hypothetical protein [Stylosanthes scabra]